MINLILLGAVAILIHQIIFLNKLKKINKHDQVLFDFCDYRREIMKYLREEGTELSLSKYNEIRQIYDITSDSIHYFSQHKLTTFNLRKIKKMIVDGKKNIDTMLIAISNDPKIAYFQRKFLKTHSKAIIKFTPFFQFFMIEYILRWIIRIYIIKRVQTLLDYWQTYEEYANLKIA